MSKTNPVFSTNEIVSAIEDSFFAAWTAFGILPGAELRETAEALLLYTGLDDSNLNAIIKSRFSVDVAECKITSYLQYFTSKGVPFSWYIGPFTQPSDLSNSLKSHGLTLADSSAGMAMHLSNIPVSHHTPIPLQCERIVNTEQLRTWVNVFQIGYEASDTFAQAVLETYMAETKAQEIRYLGWYENRPVATLTLTIDNQNVASVYDVSTVPSARRKGIASAMTHCALLNARKWGCSLAVLQSSEEAYELYKKLGFREYCIFERYMLPTHHVES